MRKNKKGRLLLTMGWLLILSAVGLTACNMLEAQQAGKSAFESAALISQLVMPTQRPAANVTVHVPEIAESAIDVHTITLPAPAPTEVVYPDYVLNPNMDMPVIQIDGENYIGLLEIPALELKLPVMDEWSYPRLKKSPCRYTGSAYLDNLVISAHNYESHFGRLKELNEGSRVVFSDSDGNRFLYEVILIETLMPTDIREMTSGEFDLTLFTCTIGGKQRVTVRCDRVDALDV